MQYQCCDYAYICMLHPCLDTIDNTSITLCICSTKGQVTDSQTAYDESAPSVQTLQHRREGHPSAHRRPAPQRGHLRRRALLTRRRKRDAIWRQQLRLGQRKYRTGDARWEGIHNDYGDRGAIHSHRYRVQRLAEEPGGGDEAH